MGNNASISGADIAVNDPNVSVTLAETLTYSSNVNVLPKKNGQRGLHIEYKRSVNGDEAFFKKLSNSKADRDLKELFIEISSYESVVTNAKLPLRLRHPGILPIHKYFVKNGCFYITGESAQPLVSCLENLCLEEIILGLHSLLGALDFLHNVAKLSHNNLSTSAIFVCGDCSWKLGCFELTTPMSRLSQPVLKVVEAIRKRPEDTRAVAFSSDRLDAYDMFCFSQLVLEIWETVGCEEETVLGLARVVENSGLHADPRMRLTAIQLKQHAVFRHSYVEISDFLATFTTKSETEKQQFFGSLPDRLLHLPESLIARRLVHSLLARLVVVDRLAQPMLRLLLRPYRGEHRPTSGQHLLSEAVFKCHVIPLLVLIFHVQERCVRMALLDNFSSYCHLFERGTLRTKILPKIRMGLLDSHAPLVGATLHALGDIAVLLGPEAVTGQPPNGIIFPENAPKLATHPPPVSEKPPPTQSKLKDLAALSANYTPPIKASGGVPGAGDTTVASTGGKLLSGGLGVKLGAGNETDAEKLKKMQKNGNNVGQTSDPAWRQTTKQENQAKNIPEMARSALVAMTTTPGDDPVEDDVEAEIPYDEDWGAGWGDPENQDTELDQQELPLENLQPSLLPVGVELPPLRTHSSLSNQSERSSTAGSSLTSNQKRGGKSKGEEMGGILDVKELDVVSRNVTEEAINDLFADMEPIISRKTSPNIPTPTHSADVPTDPNSTSGQPSTSLMRPSAYEEGVEEAGSAWTEEWDEDEETS